MKPPQKSTAQGKPKALFLVNVTRHEFVNTYNQPKETISLVKEKYWSGPGHANDHIEGRVRYYNYKNRDYVDKTEEYVTRGLYRSQAGVPSLEHYRVDQDPQDFSDDESSTIRNDRTRPILVSNQRGLRVNPAVRPRVIPISALQPLTLATYRPETAASTQSVTVPDSPIMSPTSPLTQAELEQEQERAEATNRVLQEIRARVQARYPNIDEVLASRGPNLYLLVTEDFVVAAVKPHSNPNNTLVINQRLRLMWPSRLLGSLTRLSPIWWIMLSKIGSNLDSNNTGNTLYHLITWLINQACRF